VGWLTPIALAAVRIELYTFIDSSFILTIVVICPVANNWLIFVKSDGILPALATLRFIKASGLNLRRVNFNKVSDECLVPKR